MEEKNINNVNPTEQKNNEKVIDKKTKTKKAKVAVISLCVVVGLFTGMQVYASTNGYGNVFFMIKNLITTGTLSGKTEIFSDEEITLSYKSIDLAEGLKIQVNRIETKDNKSTIYLKLKAEESAKDLLPLNYKDSKGNNYTSKVSGVNDSDDKIELNYAIDKTLGFSFDILDKNGNILRTLEIDFENREINIKGEGSVGKISEIELKKYLNVFAELNNDWELKEKLLVISRKCLLNVENRENTVSTNDRELNNTIIKEFYGDKADFTTAKNSKGETVEVLKLGGAGSAWEYDAEYDVYMSCIDGVEYKNGHCLKIEDINYENGIYTVKYIYTLANGIEEDEDKLEELPQYETTIKLKRIEENKYSKYQVVSQEKGTEVKNKVSTKVEDDQKEETNLTNSITSMTWKTYENKMEGMSFEYPTDFTVVEGPDRDVIVDMTGKVIGKDIDTGKAVESKLKIRMYSTKTVDSDSKEKYTKSGTGYTNKDGSKWHLNYIEGYNTPGTSGYQRIENYVNCEDLGNGRYLLRMIEFEPDIRENYKVTNIINKVMGSIKLLKIPDDSIYNNTTNTTVSTNTSSNRENYINSTNWVEVWPEGIGMKFKLPNGFAQAQTVRIDDNDIFVDFKGNVTLKLGNENQEQIPVRIRFWNEFNDNLSQDKALRYDAERNVQSTDNKGWTDWMPLSEGYGLETTPESGYVRRQYGRMRDNQIERVIFDIKTIGIDVDHYRFMGNVLSSISSTSV